MFHFMQDFSMRHFNTIIKILIVAATVGVTEGMAKAESRWAESTKQLSAQATALDKKEHRVMAAGTAVVHGTFYLIRSSCVGTSDAFNALMYIRQKGSRFVVQDSAGMKLTGKGNHTGFSVKSRRLDRRSGIRTTHVISAGPVLSDYTANFRYTATLQRLTDGASCQVIFEGNLRVN